MIKGHANRYVDKLKISSLRFGMSLFVCYKSRIFDSRGFLCTGMTFRQMNFICNKDRQED